jgi:hypothetical protein
VGQHEKPSTRLGRDPARLSGCQVPVVAGQAGVGVGERGFADQHVRPVRQLERGVAEPGVHDERETLAAPGFADLIKRDQLAAGRKPARALQPADVGTGDASGGQFAGKHAPPVRLDQPVAEGRHRVRQRPRLQPEGGDFGYHATAAHGPFSQRERVMEQGRVPQAREDLVAFGRVMGLHHVGYPVQGHPLQHARQPQAVIAVKVRDADAGDLARGHAGEQHLALGSLPRVKQQAFSVPAQEVAVVVAVPGGRLARRAENNQLTIGHEPDPMARVTGVSSPPAIGQEGERGTLLVPAILHRRLRHGDRPAAAARRPREKPRPSPVAGRAASRIAGPVQLRPGSSAA